MSTESFILQQQRRRRWFPFVGYIQGIKVDGESSSWYHPPFSTINPSLIWVFFFLLRLFFRLAGYSGGGRCQMRRAPSRVSNQRGSFSFSLLIYIYINLRSLVFFFHTLSLFNFLIWTPMSSEKKYIKVLFYNCTWCGFDWIGTVNPRPCPTHPQTFPNAVRYYYYQPSYLQIGLNSILFDMFLFWLESRQKEEKKKADWVTKQRRNGIFTWSKAKFEMTWLQCESSHLTHSNELNAIYWLLRSANFETGFFHSTQMLSGSQRDKSKTDKKARFI